MSKTRMKRLRRQRRMRMKSRMNKMSHLPHWNPHYPPMRRRRVRGVRRDNLVPHHLRCIFLHLFDVICKRVEAFFWIIMCQFHPKLFSLCQNILQDLLWTFHHISKGSEEKGGSLSLLINCTSTPLRWIWEMILHIDRVYLWLTSEGFSKRFGINPSQLHERNYRECGEASEGLGLNFLLVRSGHVLSPK